MRLIRFGRLKVLSALIVLLVCAGCEMRVHTGSEAAVEKTTEGVTEIRILEDGTRCVVYRYWKGGGIDCDWQAN